MKFRTILRAVGALLLIGSLSGCFCFDTGHGGGGHHGGWHHEGGHRH